MMTREESEHVYGTGDDRDAGLSITAKAATDYGLRLLM